jgi:DNA repair protein SbcC/Rad50
MRPIKLTMSAFGPYSGKQVIDFTKLEKRNIFLITGPTGAGKTTIFDGISFATFGKASGSDRDGENLRSDFADENTLTFVELEFELKGKKYYIKRIPKQIKKKARGEGFTEQKSEAELKLLGAPDSKIITGVSDVNESISSILGISYDQFRQIIMIPQGEFRELLTSDSQKREDILQKIFGTQSYRKIQELLKDMANLLKVEAENLRNRRSENIKKIDAAGNLVLQDLCQSQNPNITEIEEQLTQLIANDKKNIERIKLTITEADKNINKKQTKIFKTEENNKKFSLREQIEIEKNLLEAKQPEYEAKKLVYTNARKALTISGLEENYVSRQANVGIKQSELRDIRISFEVAEKNLNVSKEKFLLEKSKEGQRNKLIERKGILNGYLEKVKNLETLKKEYIENEAGLKRLENEKENRKTHIEGLKLEIKELSIKLEEARTAGSEYIKCSSELERETQIFNKLKSLYEELLNEEKISNSCLQKLEEKSKAEMEFEKIKKEFEVKQKTFFEGQAGFMAYSLDEGIPCPVCGSTHHPKPAEKLEGVPSEEELKNVKSKMDLADRKYRINSEQYNKLEAQLAAKRDVIENNAVELAQMVKENVAVFDRTELKEYAVKQGNILKPSINSLKKRVLALESKKENEVILLEKLKKQNESLEIEETLFSKENVKYEAIFGEVKVQKGNLDGIISQLPQNVRSLKELLLEISKVEEESDSMKISFEKFEKQYSEFAKVFERTATELKSCEKALIEAQEDFKNAEVAFLNAVTNEGFNSKENYINAKLANQKLELLERSIAQFNENLKSVRDRYAKAALDIEGLRIEDTNKFKNEIAILIEEKEAKTEEKENELFRVKNNLNALESIRDLNSKLEEKENKYNIIGDLANTARGNNSEKITFERYVLAAFFDDIVDAANLRLSKMSSGRYELNRIEERTKGNAQSGLELQVFDNYTGKARHVKTLSGGESFKASLSMALGLADVVQSYAGGISLDTMFIDEGFGTLDSESLDSAIECLIELQSSGRLVGIISHVPELKERIDAWLEIEPGKLGSTAKFNIV